MRMQVIGELEKRMAVRPSQSSKPQFDPIDHCLKQLRSQLLSQRHGHEPALIRSVLSLLLFRSSLSNCEFVMDLYFVSVQQMVE